MTGIARILCGCILWAAATVDAQAQSTPVSGFFVGGGVGFSVTSYGTQSVYNKGISDIYENGVLRSSGTADGPPVAASFDGASRATPDIQIGYFRRFVGSEWLWGAKLSYNYLGARSGVQDLVIPQFGTSTDPGNSSFVGYSVTQSYSVSISHQFASLFFVGRSFGRGFWYVGAGPSLSQIKVNLDGVVGYATLNGILTNVSGAPQSFAETTWRFGAAATAGITYFLTPSIFLDAKYLFSAPKFHTFSVTSPFNNPGTPTTFTGTLIGTATANVRNTQAVTVAINKMF